MKRRAFLKRLDNNYYKKSHRYWIFGHVMKHKKKVLVIMALTLIGIVIQTSIPLIFGDAIDTAIPQNDQDLLLFYAVLIIVMGIFRAGLSYIASILNEQVAQYVEMQVRLELFQNLSGKNMDFFNKSRVGDLMSQATQDTQNLTFAISPGIRSVISAVFGLLAAAIAMVSLSLTLAVVFFTMMPFYIYFLYRYAQNLQPVSMERQERLAKINSLLQENITGIRVVRTFSAQEDEKELFHDDIRKYEDVLIKRGAISAYFIPTLLLGLMTAVIFLLGAYLIELGREGIETYNLLGIITIPVAELTVGNLIAFITLIGMLVWPTNILRFLLDVTMLGFAGSERIFNTLTTKADLKESKQKIIEDVEGRVHFEQVTFSYESNGHNALEEFDLEINPGETIAIIGPTGSGKSTVGNVLLRLYDIDRGNIKIDGINIQDLDISHLRQIIGIIEQDIYLFSTTIKANIAYGIQDASDEQIMEAAQAAQAHDFIMEFKDGYDTIVGERGVTLSGGQKQRIAMARTFITDPKILIMDDSTSAIDAETEAKIQAAMTQLLKNRTTIIITHRLSTLRDADRIVFMRKGKIERLGTHDELLNSYEPYRQIFRGYIPLPPVEEA